MASALEIVSWLIAIGIAIFTTMRQTDNLSLLYLIVLAMSYFVINGIQPDVASDDEQACEKLRARYIISTFFAIVFGAVALWYNISFVIGKNAMTKFANDQVKWMVAISIFYLYAFFTTSLGITLGVQSG